MNEQGDKVAADLAACRLESTVAATAVLAAAAQLVEAMPTELAVDEAVYAGLQRLGCSVETAIFAADLVRNQEGGQTP